MAHKLTYFLVNKSTLRRMLGNKQMLSNCFPDKIPALIFIE
ncbi:hypothetical protein SX4_0080 [Vibrio mimicus SX-4]|nr:hypothetical protein SX4_0080 [Vibrio mimicus SX-4]